MIHFSLKNQTPRGFTLLIALIFTSAVLAVGLALLNISYNQVILSSTSRQSEYAFYAADAAMECALYWDNKQDTFDYINEPVGASAGNISCENQTFSYTAYAASGNTRETTFNIPCASGGVSASVSVYKSSSGSTSVFANGFNICDTTNPQRIERGLQSSY